MKRGSRAAPKGDVAKKEDTGEGHTSKSPAGATVRRSSRARASKTSWWAAEKGAAANYLASDSDDGESGPGGATPRKRVKKEAAGPAAKGSGSSNRPGRKRKAEVSVEEHGDYCEVCGKEGNLLCCDGCVRVYHLGCLAPPLKSVPKDDWFCPVCASERATQLAAGTTARQEKAKREVMKDSEEEEEDDEAEQEEDDEDEESDESDESEEDERAIDKILCIRRKKEKAANGEDKAKLEAGEKGKEKGKDKKKEGEETPSKRQMKDGFGDSIEILVKWKDRAYIHSEWIDERTVLRLARIKYLNFLRSLMEEQGPVWDVDLDDLIEAQEDSDAMYEHGIKTSWTVIDRIVKSKKERDGTQSYLVKWDELDYDQCTWEQEKDIKDLPDFQQKLELFRQFNDPANMQAAEKKLNADQAQQKAFKKYKQQSTCLGGGELHDYQLEGVNWLLFSWHERTNVVLADEMGLGKTIQSLAFISTLMFDKGCWGPFLVVAPLSTLANWKREFQQWVPNVNVVLYLGSQDSRRVIRETEFFFEPDKLKSAASKTRGKDKKKERQPKPYKFNVLITSYDMIRMDLTYLQRPTWECLVVDEAHRLKNKNSVLFQSLSQFKTKHRVLLTGTPLQNNLSELFHLMQFIEPERFPSVETFESEFPSLEKEEQVKKLHALLAPHMLRRVKGDVKLKIPPKSEFIIRVELSRVQKELYRAILTKNYQLLTGVGSHGGGRVSLLNVVSQLQKCCNHPYLFESYEPKTETREEAVRLMVQASGKLLLLDKMLTKLHQQGHRVLIFSQMTRLLDVLEDYLYYKNYSYERIDGNIIGRDRQERIDRFNTDHSKFVFLLSTRAGGLGINLATADTVFIYDSDWNPHNDIQAFSRAHRIGQVSKVMIYRLVTRATVEETIIQRAKEKMMLDHLVVRRMGSKGAHALKQAELDSILRFGSAELFKEEHEAKKKREAEAEQAKAQGGEGVSAAEESAAAKAEDDANRIIYDDAAIDALLDRSQVAVEQKSVAQDDYLNSFKVASFSGLKTSTSSAPTPTSQEAVQNEEEEEDFWEKLLASRYEEFAKENEEAMGKGRRTRSKLVRYSEVQQLEQEESVNGMEDEDYSESSSAESEKDSQGVSIPRGPGRPRKKPRLEGQPPKSSTRLMQGEGKAMKVLGFSASERAAFQKMVLMFGLGDGTWRHLIRERGALKRKSYAEIVAYGNLYLAHLLEPKDLSSNPSTYADGVPKDTTVKRKDILTRIAKLHLIESKMRSTEALEDFDIRDGGWTELQQRWRDDVSLWQRRHDYLLLQAVLQEGYGKWKEIMKGEAGPELLTAASAERKRQREDGVKLRGGVKKEANKAVAATEEDEEEANEHSDTDEDKEEANGGAPGKREREKVDYIALGFMRSRLHTLEEALSVEQQLKRLGLLDGKGTASADEYEFSDGDARQGNGQTRGTTGDNTPTPTSVPSSPLIMSATSDAPSEGSSPMILDAAANSSDESDGDDYTPTRRRGPQPGNGDHDAATAATDDIERNFLDTLQNDPKYKFVVQFKELFSYVHRTREGLLAPTSAEKLVHDLSLLEELIGETETALDQVVKQVTRGSRS